MRGWRRGGVAALTLALAATGWGAANAQQDDLASEVRRPARGPARPPSQLRAARQGHRRHRLVSPHRRRGPVREVAHRAGHPTPTRRTPRRPGATNPVKFWAYIFVRAGSGPPGQAPAAGAAPRRRARRLQHLLHAHRARADGTGLRGDRPGVPRLHGLRARRTTRRSTTAAWRSTTRWRRGTGRWRRCDFVDAERVGILGWSHGGLIALMAVFDHPDKFQVAYAGVPVSDLVARMGYQTQDYRDLYSADYHVGKTADEDVEEYQRRSPAWNAHKLRTSRC